MLYVSWSRKSAAMAPIKSSLKVGNCHLFDFNRSFKSTETEDKIQTKILVLSNFILPKILTFMQNSQRYAMMTEAFRRLQMITRRLPKICRTF